MPAELHPVAERRDEQRFLTTISVSAGHPHSSIVIEGVTVDVSTSGMCLHMPVPPPSAHQDVVVENGEARSMLWAQVLGFRDAPVEGYLWHVRVTAADAAWSAIVQTAEETQEPEPVAPVAARQPRRQRPRPSARRSKRTA